MDSSTAFRGLVAVAARNLAAALAVVLATSLTVHAQKDFSSPEAAMNAFGDAVVKDREDALRSILGSNFRDLIPPVGAELRERFIAEWEKSHSIEPKDAGHAHIAIGNDGWTLPIPLVKTTDGWRFDMQAGAEEMRLRRIGRNELAVIQTMFAIYGAQREYSQTDHDSEGVLAYASRMVSSRGKQDGLYSPTPPNERPNPLGAAFVDASERNAGYHGYHYKLLESQGPYAPGGAYDYVVDGKLFGGFAVVAWPVQYGSTGIKSFMVSHAGQVYERDLGPDGAAKAGAMKSFDRGLAGQKSPTPRITRLNGATGTTPSDTPYRTASCLPRTGLFSPVSSPLPCLHAYVNLSNFPKIPY